MYPEVGVTSLSSVLHISLQEPYRKHLSMEKDVGIKFYNVKEHCCLLHRAG